MERSQMERTNERTLRRAESSADLRRGLAKLDFQRGLRDRVRGQTPYQPGEHGRLRRYFSSPDLTAIHKTHYAGADDTVSRNMWLPTRYLPSGSGVDSYLDGYSYMSPLYWSVYKYPGRRYRISDFEGDYHYRLGFGSPQSWEYQLAGHYNPSYIRSHRTCHYDLWESMRGRHYLNSFYDRPLRAWGGIPGSYAYRGFTDAPFIRPHNYYHQTFY